MKVIFFKERERENERSREQIFNQPPFSSKLKSKFKLELFTILESILFIEGEKGTSKVYV